MSKQWVSVGLDICRRGRRSLLRLLSGIGLGWVLRFDDVKVLCEFDFRGSLSFVFGFFNLRFGC